MAGLIWFVQLVHYPLFDAVDPDRFGRSARICAPAIAATGRDEVGVLLSLAGPSARGSIPDSQVVPHRRNKSH